MAAPPHEFLALYRGDHQRGIFLGHADRIAIDVFVHDQIAQYGDAKSLELFQRGAQIRHGEAMSFRESLRADDRRKVGLQHFPLEQVNGGEAHVAGTEQQLAAIAVDGLLFGVGVGFVFLALDHDRRLQFPDESFRRNAQDEGMVDEADGPDSDQPQLFRNQGAIRMVPVDADHEIVSAFRSELEQPKMAGMERVEISGNENDALAWAGLSDDSGGNFGSAAHG